MNKTKSAYGEKTKAIRQVLQTNPHLKNRELAALLTAQGIDVISQDVANVKFSIKRQGKTSNPLTLDTLIKIKSTVKAAGGFKVVQQKIAEVYQLADRVGGLAKLRQGLEILPEFQK